MRSIGPGAHASVGPSPSETLDGLGRTGLPPWALVRRRLDATPIGDIDDAIEAALGPVADRIRPGSRVCLAVGSRGIDRIAEVTRAMVDASRRRGALPFVVPAMGSHGGATPAGQREVLKTLGITEASVGCEIRAGMDTVQLGTVRGRIPVYFDRIVLEQADAVIPINRVKLHTDFTGPAESGLLKMIAIGLGKQRGADTLHSEGFAAFAELIPEVAACTLARVPIPFGIALLEDRRSRLRRLEAVPGEAIHAREPALRDEAESHLARLPVTAVDVLVVDRIGKDVSGLGMDSNVTGRYYAGPTGRGPAVQRIIVRGLTDATEGNAVGIGMADVVLQRAVDQVDPVPTWVNCVTAKTPEGARIGITARTDRQALGVALACCVGTHPEQARILRIADTKRLEILWASEPLLPEILDREDAEVVEPVHAIRFDADGMFADRDPADTGTGVVVPSAED